MGETETAKLEVHFIGNPRPEVILIAVLSRTLTATITMMIKITITSKTMAMITMAIRLARITTVTIQVIWTRDGEELVNSRCGVIFFKGLASYC